MPEATEKRGSAQLDSQSLHDLQSEADHRALPIDQVGIRGLEIPITIQDQDSEPINTIGVFDVFVDLDASLKGTHMSRFVEILHDQDQPYSIDNLGQILTTVRDRLNANAAYLTVKFPFFLEKAAPITLRPSMMNYQVIWKATLIDNVFDLLQTVVVPVKTLCPCSKSISKYGAHNQRGLVTVKTRSRQPLWISQTIELVEASGSSELYALLKRPDEKHVTERAYENPVFVEDLVRNVVSRLRADDRVVWYEVEAENQESIHNHNAYAMIRKGNAL